MAIWCSELIQIPSLKLNKHIKLVYCGTGGAERVHISSDGIYSRGNSCINIEFKGKHIQIDCPPDMPDSFLKYNLRLSDIDYLLITHSHKDHCYPYDILNAKIGNYEYPVEFKNRKIDIYANKDVSSIILNAVRENRNEIEKRDDGFSFKKYHVERIRVHLIRSGKKEQLFTGAEILPIRTDHQNSNAFGYIMRFNDVIIIYLPDFWSITGVMHEIISGYGLRFNLVILGCPIPYYDITEPFHSHATLKVILEYYNLLKEKGLLNNNCTLHLTHLSPRWIKPDIMEKASNDIRESGLEDRVILVEDGDLYQI